MRTVWGMDENANAATAEVVKKKPRGKPFAKGWKGGPGRGNVAPPKSHGATVLADLEFVYSHPRTEDKTPGQKASRKMLTGDYKGFLVLMRDMQKAVSGESEARARELEKELKAEREAREKDARELGLLRVSGGNVATSASAGEQEERVEELIGELLGRMV